jgi:putative ABC transport system substrate-binding protein
MPCSRQPRTLAFTAFAAACVAAIACTAAQAARLIVVQAADTPRLVRTLQALKSHVGVPVDVIRLPATGPALESVLSRPERETVVVALGPRASDAVADIAPPAPVVHCLAGADALRAGLPAVPAEPPADQKAVWLRKLVPGARSVGVLFDPSLNARHAQAIAAALDIAGYKVLLQPVASPAALPSALASLAGRADVLLAVPDRTVYAPEAANGILLFSFRRNMPLIGPNDAWVRRGALFAVDWDYDEVGATCAALALRELSVPKSAPPVPPRPNVWLNTKLAPRFGLAWDRELLATPGVHHE